MIEVSFRLGKQCSKQSDCGSKDCDCYLMPSSGDEKLHIRSSCWKTDDMFGSRCNDDDDGIVGDDVAVGEREKEEKEKNSDLRSKGKAMISIRLLKLTPD